MHPRESVLRLLACYLCVTLRSLSTAAQMALAELSVRIWYFPHCACVLGVSLTPPQDAVADNFRAFVAEWKHDYFAANTQPGVGARQSQQDS